MAPVPIPPGERVSREAYPATGEWTIDTEGNVVPVPWWLREDTLPAPGEPLLEEVLVAGGPLPTDTSGAALPRRKRLPFFTAMYRLSIRAFRWAAAGLRAVIRGGRITVGWIDGLLRRMVGLENAILHGFFRVLALAAFVVALAFAVRPLLAPLGQKLGSALRASSEDPPFHELEQPSGATGGGEKRR